MLSLAACGDRVESEPADEQIVPFDSATVRLATARDTIPLTLQLAVSGEQRTMGLMERRRLAENAGMLFVYDSTQPPNAGFWMYRTRIPLDIAFLDSAGVIRAIRTMVPCETTIPEGCPTYTPDVPYRYALEVNAGFFQSRGVRESDALLIQDLPSTVPR